MPREKNVQSKLIAALRARGAYTKKFHSSAYTGSGASDVWCCYRGKFVCFEVKHPKFKKAENQLSQDQVANINAIREAGGIAHAVSSVEEAMALLESYFPL